MKEQNNKSRNSHSPATYTFEQGKKRQRSQHQHINRQLLFTLDDCLKVQGKSNTSGSYNAGMPTRNKKGCNNSKTQNPIHIRATPKEVKKNGQHFPKKFVKQRTNNNKNTEKNEHHLSQKLVNKQTHLSKLQRRPSVRKETRLAEYQSERMKNNLYIIT